MLPFSYFTFVNIMQVLDKYYQIKSLVVENFMDVSTPLNQFTDAVNLPEGIVGREGNFNQMANTAGV